MKKFYIAATIALALLFNITIVSQQTSAYIISCVDGDNQATEHIISDV